MTQFSFIGSALIKIGQTQLRLGGAEREFVRAAMTTFVGPLKRFLEGDMKTIMVRSQKCFNEYVLCKK